MELEHGNQSTEMQITERPQRRRQRQLIRAFPFRVGLVECSSSLIRQDDEGESSTIAALLTDRTHRRRAQTVVGESKFVVCRSNNSTNDCEMEFANFQTHPPSSSTHFDCNSTLSVCVRKQFCVNNGNVSERKYALELVQVNQSSLCILIYHICAEIRQLSRIRIHFGGEAG